VTPPVERTGLSVRRLCGNTALWLTLLFPFFKRYIGSASAAQFLLNGLVAVPCLVLAVLAPVRWRIRLIAFLAASLALAFLLFVVSAFAEASAARTASDVGRVLLVCVYVYAGYVCCDLKIWTEERLIRTVTLYCAAGTLFSLLVLFRPAYWLVDLYKGRLSDDPLAFHFKRASGFSGYPTDFGCLLLFGILLAMIAGQRGMMAARRKWVLVGMFAAGVIASAARGALIQVAGLALIGGVPLLVRSKARARWALLIIGVAFLAILGNDAVSPSLDADRDASSPGELQFKNYVSVSAGNPDASILHRFAELALAKAQLVDRPTTLPTGKDRDTPGGLDVIESLYGHYLIRYGWLGALFVVVWSGCIIYAAKTSASVVGRAYYLWFVSFILFVAPFSDVMSRLRGLPLYSLLLGYVLATERRARIAVNTCAPDQPGPR
jgi:hypothetical protein